MTCSIYLTRFRLHPVTEGTAETDISWTVLTPPHAHHTRQEFSSALKHPETFCHNADSWRELMRLPARNHSSALNGAPNGAGGPRRTGTRTNGSAHSKNTPRARVPCGGGEGPGSSHKDTSPTPDHRAPARIATLSTGSRPQSRNNK